MLSTLLYVGLIAICPLAMVLMMRGSVGRTSDQSADTVARDVRIAQLEQEVTTLRRRSPNEDREVVGTAVSVGREAP